MYQSTGYFQGAPMDTDVRGTAWFHVPGASYFPALGNRNVHYAPKATVTSNLSPFSDGVNNTERETLSSASSYDGPLPVYKMYLKQIMQGRGSSRARFRSTNGAETVMKDGVARPVNVRYQCLTRMPEYEDESFEEIRLEDYITSSLHGIENNTNTRTPEPPRTKQIQEPPHPQQSPHSQPVEIPSQPSLLSTVLQNVATTVSSKNVTTENIENDALSKVCGDSKLDLLQALLNHVKQRFDVKHLSDEAKRSCADLTQALVVFTEKTLENLTVVVLEDMLREIKQRSVSVPDTSDKSTNTCPRSEKDTSQNKDAEYSKTPNRSKKAHAEKGQDEEVSSKYLDGCSSDCEESDEDGEIVYNEPEHHCELANRTRKAGGHKKTVSLPASLGKSLSRTKRSMRHSLGYTFRSTDRLNRYRGHRKLGDEKYCYREKTCDDSDSEEFVNRNNDSKNGYRDDRRITLTKARLNKLNRHGLQSMKTTPKEMQLVMQDECRICDGVKRVTIDNINWKEYVAIKEQNPLTFCKERKHATKVGCVDKEVEVERERANKSLSALTTYADNSGVARNEFDETRSHSDSSV